MRMDILFKRLCLVVWDSFDPGGVSMWVVAGGGWAGLGSVTCDGGGVCAKAKHCLISYGDASGEVNSSTKVGWTSLVSRLSACLTEAKWWRLIAE